MDNHDSALQDLEIAIGLKPDNPDVWIGRGATRRCLGDKNGAIEDATRAINLTPDDHNTYAIRARWYRDIEKFDEALADINMAVKLNPQEANNLYWRGLILKDKKEYLAALADLKKAIDIDGEKSYYWREIGIINFQLGLFEEALRSFTRAIELQPDSAVNYHFRGVLFYATKHPNTLDDFTKAIELDPTNSNHYLWRGGTWLDNYRDLDKTLQDFSKAVEVTPNQSAVYYWRSQLLIEKREYEASLDDLHKAVALEMRSRNLFFRGVVFLLLNRVAENEADFTAAVEIAKTEKQCSCKTTPATIALLKGNYQNGVQLYREFLDEWKYDIDKQRVECCYLQRLSRMFPSNEVLKCGREWLEVEVNKIIPKLVVS